MDNNSFTHGVPSDLLQVHEWATTPGWVRFADGKKRFVKRGAFYLCAVQGQEGDETSIMLLEEIILH